MDIPLSQHHFFSGILGFYLLNLADLSRGLATKKVWVFLILGSLGLTFSGEGLILFFPLSVNSHLPPTFDLKQWVEATKERPGASG